MASSNENTGNFASGFCVGFAPENEKLFHSAF